MQQAVRPPAAFVVLVVHAEPQALHPLHAGLEAGPRVDGFVLQVEVRISRGDEVLRQLAGERAAVLL